MTITGDQVTLDSAVAGVQGSGNVDKLVLSFDPGWDGYAKSACWWDGRGAQAGEPRLLTAELLEDLAHDTRRYVLVVPPEALAAPGECALVIEGWRDGALARTVEQTFRVIAAPAAAVATEVTPTQAQQLQQQLDALAADLSQAMEAQESAQTACGLAQTALEQTRQAREDAGASCAQALSAQAAAESARDGAVSAQIAAQSAQTAAQNARTAVESARSAAAQSAQEAQRDAQRAISNAQIAVKASNAAQSAQGVAEGARDAAVAAQAAAEGARNGAVAAQTAVENARNAAAQSAQEAQRQAQMTQAVGALAETAAADAAHWADEAGGYAARQEFLMRVWAAGGDTREVCAIEQALAAGAASPMAMEETELERAVWSSFISSAAKYYEDWDGASFTFAPLNDDVIRDALLLRLDAAGTTISRAQLFSGDPDNDYDLLSETFDSIQKASNGASYIDSAYHVLKELSWYEFQYAIIHRKELYAGAEMPGEAACMAEAAVSYTWRYRPIQPALGRLERQVDANTWSDFIRAAADYFEMYDGAAFTFPLTDEVIRDDLLLRADVEGNVIALADFFKGDPNNVSDIILDTLDAIMNALNGRDYIDANYRLLRSLTWYEFQYALIHRSALAYMPDDATCQRECRSSYAWKYENVGADDGEFFVRGGLYCVEVTRGDDTAEKTVVCHGQRVEVGEVVFDFAAAAMTNTAQTTAAVRMSYVPVSDYATSWTAQRMAVLEARITALEEGSGT